MKGFVKVIIAGAIILGLGIAVLIITLGINNWQINGDYEMKTYGSEQTNTALEVSFVAGQLEISYFEGDKILIEYPENKGYTTEITENDGTLRFSVRSNHWINLGFFHKIPATVIRLPQGYAMDLNLKMNAGLTKIAGGKYGKINIDMNAGTLELGDGECKSLAVKMNAGATSIGKIASEQGVSCELNAGAIEIGSLACPSLALDVNAGALEVKNLTTDKIGVDVSAGSVELKVNGAEDDYAVYIDKSAGSCNLSSHGSSTDKYIRADISAGSLEVRFDK